MSHKLYVVYNRLSEEPEIKIDQSKQVIANLERGIEKLQSNVTLYKDIVADALKNFDALNANRLFYNWDAVHSSMGNWLS